ncbi:MAG: cytochrome c3 family protein [Nitrospirae bacterium]|nr:cytochrome c3 family protein [Nitrospirota bacterium]
MQKIRRILVVLIPLLLAGAALTDGADAKDIVLSDEAGTCLGCHGKQGIVKTFENGELLSAYVSPEKFAASVHNFLPCSGCHSDFSSDNHPSRRFRSKKQYQIKTSRECRRCHGDQQLKENPIHAGLLRAEGEGKPAVCTECHGAHSVSPIKGGKVFASETQYCLGCHGHPLSMAFRNGEQLSLSVDKKLLDTSVHGKLSCSDCHYGFSSEEHPQRIFKSGREYTLASSESCRRCHFDKYSKTIESIHYTVLSKGNLKAPVCTDCHGAHSISGGSRERSLTTKRCQRCHPAIYDVYARSIHGKALFDEKNQDVPVCIDCHKAHDILNPHTLDYRERIPTMCSNCHANKAIMGKYGLSTDVVKTYLSDFHGVTLGFYRKQRESLDKPARPIAVCTDCHGTHNITSTRGTDAAVLKANLVQRCQQCHKDAPRDFPNTWLSHYEPNMKSAPLVFLVNLLYKIFIPVLVVGLFLQILLHIWRYAVDR